MLEPFATLIFLATLWLIVRTIVDMIDESGGRIAAALLGRPYRVETSIPPLPVRFSRPRAAGRPLAAQQRHWRDAA